MLTIRDLMEGHPRAAELQKLKDQYQRLITGEYSGYDLHDFGRASLTMSDTLDELQDLESIILEAAIVKMQASGLALHEREPITDRDCVPELIDSPLSPIGSFSTMQGIKPIRLWTEERVRETMLMIGKILGLDDKKEELRMWANELNALVNLLQNLKEEPKCKS